MDKCEEGTKELIRNVINGDLENVKRIVKSGVDIDASEGISRGYYTPAIMAALSGHDHIIDYLASCGADLDKPDVFGHPPIAPTPSRIILVVSWLCMHMEPVSIS
jgi:hypothetical protein